MKKTTCYDYFETNENNSGYNAKRRLKKQGKTNKNMEKPKIFSTCTVNRM